MRVDRRELSRHYASLSDEELLSLDADELTDEARAVYDKELADRSLLHGGAGVQGDPYGEPQAADGLDEPADVDEFQMDGGPEPEWLADAACACAFAAHSETSDIPDAIKARDVLRESGIPCRVTMADEESRPEYRRQRLLRVMVPGPLALHATSILDRDLFNQEHEADWRAHLAALSDRELRALDPEIFCAGLLDRVSRIRKAYEDEMGRRKGA